MKTFKFILWFLISVTLFLAMAAIVLPIAVITSDYLAGARFPVGLVITASFLTLICLSVLTNNLRKIEFKEAVTVKAKKVNSKSKTKVVNEIESIGVSSFKQPQSKTSPTKKIRLDKSDDFFDKHEIIEID